MKGYEVSEVGKGGQQRCQVAVANENLRMPGNRFQIKRLRSARRQQVVRSISSARTNDGPDIVAREHVFEFPRPTLRRTRKVQIAFLDPLKIKRLISYTTKTVAARFQHFALHVRRWRNNALLISLTEFARLDARILRSRRHF